MPRTGPGSDLHAKQQVQQNSPASSPSRPRMRSRADSAYLSYTDGSASENISGQGESRRQMKAGAIALPSKPPRQSDPYRSPPAVPPKYLPQPAKALPPLPLPSSFARPQKGVYPRQSILTMRYVHKNRPDGDRLDTEDFIRLVRKQVLTGNPDDTSCLIRSIFWHPDFDQYTMESKIETLMGNTRHIYASTTPTTAQADYFDAVERLYRMNKAGPHGAQIDRRLGELAKTASGEEQTKLRNKVLRDMVWTLTPNQRDSLRLEFPLLYGDHTVADDINWLFFDTVMRLYSKDEREQAEMLEPVLAASRETRLDARDKLMGSIHSRLSAAQRNELKTICRKRHDALLSSREPLLHTAIRTNNIKAVRAYVTNILCYAPPAEMTRLLLARQDTAQGKETGDAAFFSLLQSASPKFIRHFMATILNFPELTIDQKFQILDARRLHDNVSAFTMLMGSGNWPRVEEFVNVLSSWNFDDFHDMENTYAPGRFEMPGVVKIFEGATYKFRVSLLKGWRRERWMRGEFTTAYAQAIMTGHKKCARKLFKKILAIEEYLELERLGIVAYYPPRDPEKEARRLAKSRAFTAKLKKKRLARVAAMSPEDQAAYFKKEADDEAKKYKEEMAFFHSLPSVAELFADEANDVIRLRKANEAGEREMQARMEKRAQKMEARKQKIKTLFAPMSPKKSAPASPEAPRVTSRYSYSRTSPKGPLPPRSQSMPVMPVMSGMTPRARFRSYKSGGYVKMIDDSDGG